MLQRSIHRSVLHRGLTAISGDIHLKVKRLQRLAPYSRETVRSAGYEGLRDCFRGFNRLYQGFRPFGFWASSLASSRDSEEKHVLSLASESLLSIDSVLLCPFFGFHSSVLGGEKVGRGTVNVNCFFLVRKGIVSPLLWLLQGLYYVSASRDEGGKIRVFKMGRVKMFNSSDRKYTVVWTALSPRDKGLALTVSHSDPVSKISHRSTPAKDKNADPTAEPTANLWMLIRTFNHCNAVPIPGREAAWNVLRRTLGLRSKTSDTVRFNAT